jgi:hypothetical protein
MEMGHDAADPDDDVVYISPTDGTETARRRAALVTSLPVSTGLLLKLLKSIFVFQFPFTIW